MPKVSIYIQSEAVHGNVVANMYAHRAKFFLTYPNATGVLGHSLSLDTKSKQQLDDDFL